jgi:hypothetical protein
MDFCPFDVFSSSDVPEMIDQQNSWNSLVISVDVSYATPQAHRIVSVALHREFSTCIIFIFFQWMKDLYHI